MSKGSTQRPRLVDRDNWFNSWDETFGKRKKHDKGAAPGAADMGDDDAAEGGAKGEPVGLDDSDVGTVPEDAGASGGGDQC